ncbi:MAG TPA: MBL fold metallo-hydrolase [Acidimicrobiales bacterium]|nr:MBL fold metallo-hydrolase [Acidimicrobiales bacterium]
MSVEPLKVQIERVRTQGVFTLDGQDFEVENNIWLVSHGDDLVILDAAHDASAIAAAVGGRRVSTIVCTHGHNDHINAALDLAEAVSAPIALHPDDGMLWDTVHPDRAPDLELADGDTVPVGPVPLMVLHTPGHTPGGVCLYAEESGVLFSGDTLFRGGPGATGRSFSDFGAIIDSIRRKLLILPPTTVVHTGHGDDTTIGDEAPDLDEWIARGH